MSAHVDAAYLALIESARVSRNTRAALLSRAAPDDPAYRPAALDMPQLQTLRAVIDRVLPHGDPAIDLAARIDQALAAGEGDGWRFADLPPDADAYRAGLAALDQAALAHAAGGTGFADLPADARDALLHQAADGALDSPGLPAGSMRRWFEDVRSDAVRHYVAHPATLASMGYSGIAYGGDGPDKPGFNALEPGAREPWEPEALP